MDDEIYQSLKCMTAGLHVCDEALALDEIMQVGPGGHFLERDYTLKNIRELWNPGVSRQWSSGQQSFRDPQEAAVEKTKWILQNHNPKSVEEKAAKELKRIIMSAEDELVQK